MSEFDMRKKLTHSYIDPWPDALIFYNTPTWNWLLMMHEQCTDKTIIISLYYKDYDIIIIFSHEGERWKLILYMEISSYSCEIYIYKYIKIHRSPLIFVRSINTHPGYTAEA